MSENTGDYQTTSAGQVFYNRRNYNPNQYTYKNYMMRGALGVMMNDFVKNVAMAKVVCLTQAERDPEMTMMAIQRDEDYEPEFRECVSGKMNELMEARAEKNEGFNYNLAEDGQGTMIERALDMVKLNELKEHDFYLYNAFAQELKTKEYE